MTVIAFKAGVLAADTAGWQGDLHVAQVRKIVRFGDGLFAAVGREDIIAQFMFWLSKDRPDELRPSPADDEDFEGVVVAAAGAYFISGRTFMPAGPPRDMIALGPHADFLYGAMAAGASAMEAVDLAIEYCAFAGGETHYERVADVG